MWRFPDQRLGYVHLGKFTIRKIIRRIGQHERTLRVHRTRPRLTAPFGPFDADSAKGRKIEIHL